MSFCHSTSRHALNKVDHKLSTAILLYHYHAQVVRLVMGGLAYVSDVIKIIKCICCNFSCKVHNSLGCDSTPFNAAFWGGLEQMADRSALM